MHRLVLVGGRWHSSKHLNFNPVISLGLLKLMGFNKWLWNVSKFLKNNSCCVFLGSAEGIPIKAVCTRKFSDGDMLTVEIQLMIIDMKLIFCRISTVNFIVPHKSVNGNDKIIFNYEELLQTIKDCVMHSNCADFGEGGSLAIKPLSYINNCIIDYGKDF